MGTRSLTIVTDEYQKELVVMYRQFDGYPEHHGKELAKFLLYKKVINGIRLEDNKENAFNGFGCLAAALVAHFKKDIGKIYLYPAGTRDCGQDYIYYISGNINEVPNIKVDDFNGTPNELINWIDQLKDK